MAGAAKKASTRKGKKPTNDGNAPSTAMIAAATAFRDSAPLFFCLDRARFSDPQELTKVITIQLPVQHIRSKEAMHEFVLKKLLHRPFAFSAEDPTVAHVPQASSSATASAATTEGKTEEDDPFVVVHVRSIEPHADTVRQANARGDIQLNAMISLTVARVRHGVTCGCAAASPFTNCFQVVVPREEEDGKKKGKKGKPAASAKRARDENGDEADAAGASPAEETDAVSEESDPTKLCITVRCLDEEPVVAGQAVFVVSEPGGGMRCMAVRPPRVAPGPFRVLTAADAVAEQQASGKVRKGAATSTSHAPVPGAVQVVCDIPPKEGEEEVGMKGPRRAKASRAEH